MMDLADRGGSEKKSTTEKSPLNSKNRLQTHEDPGLNQHHGEHRSAPLRSVVTIPDVAIISGN